MKAKGLNILFASVFALVFLIGFASALTLSSSTTSLSQDGGSFSLILNNTGGTQGNLTYSVKDSSETSYTGFSFSQTSYTGNTTVSVTYTVPTDFDFAFKEEYTVTITATETSGTVTKSISFAASDFCESVGNLGNLRTTVEDVKVINGFGDDSDWFLFDDIEVEVLVKNGNKDVDNIVVEWGLYDVESGEWAIEVDEETDFDLNSNDEETVMITFSLNDKLDEDLQDLKEGKYAFYVRATGEVAEGTYEGNDTCESALKDNILTLEKDFVILSNIEVPEAVQCNSEVQILADVWNIGSRDQNNVYVNVYNKELKIDQDVDIGNIDSFDSSDFIFNLKLPKDIQEKKYYFTFTVYDEDDDVYENENNDKSIFSAILLNVTGGCSLAKATVSAVLESGGEAGRALVVKATITNTGDKTNTYLLDAAGYTEWASSATIDKGSLTLDAGKSGDVLLTFNVKKEALGVKLFSIEVLSGNELVVSQPVQVDITKKTFGLAGIKDFFSGNNKYIWGIAILNLILIVLIIVIAVRVSRKN